MILIFVHFRLNNLTYIVIQPKIALFQGNYRQIIAGKYGPMYASKEKLYGRHHGFLIPKASPLEASYGFLLRKVYIFILSSPLISERLQMGNLFMDGNGNKPKNGG